jgi:phosphate-selective porin OprO/OprP
MRVMAWRKPVGVLLCGTVMALLAAGPAAADDKMIEELKARLDKLEKQNEELRNKLTIPISGPYKPEPAEGKSITKIVDDYLKEKDAKKKAEEECKKAEKEAEKLAKEEEGYKVGSDLGLKVRWNPSQGLLFETEKKDFVSHIGFFMQWDTVSWTQNKALRLPTQVGPLEDGTFFRRIRPLWDGTAWETVEWNVILALEQVQGSFSNVNPQAAPNTPTSISGAVNANINVDEVWAGVYGLPIIGRLRGGHMKVPQGLEGDMWSSSRCMTFQERAAYTDAFYNNFGTGVAAMNSFWCGPYGDRMTYQVMGYRDDNPRTNTGEDFGDGDYAITGRMTALLIDECEDRHFLHVGVSGTWRKAQRPGNDLGGTEPVVQFRARPELRDSIGGFDGDPVGIFPGDNSRLVDTGAILANSATVVGTELWYNLGPFNVMAEWAVARMNDAVVTTGSGRTARTVIADRTFNGGYVTVSYFLTGESQVYDHTYGRRGTFYIERPFTNFWAKWDEDHGVTMGLGAWEVAARYSYLNLNDGPIQGGVLQGLTLGLNWYLASNLKVQFEYLNNARWDKGGTGTVTGGAGNIPGTVQGFGTRLQIQF